jgi:hypothetical protein
LCESRVNRVRYPFLGIIGRDKNGYQGFHNGLREDEQDVARCN